MSTFKSTNHKKNFANPFGSLPDPSAHKQTKSLYNIDFVLLKRFCFIKKMLFYYKNFVLLQKFYFITKILFYYKNFVLQKFCFITKILFYYLTNKSAAICVYGIRLIFLGNIVAQDIY